jgi:FG-GAP-like repeat/Dual-action HEIGH metallo-peptidase
MRMIYNKCKLIALVSIFSVFTTNAMAQENIGSTSQPLVTSKNISLWTSQSNTVPVCWETAGYDREKKITQEAVVGTWQFWANINFTGWNACPTSGDSQHVRIKIAAQDSSNAGSGGNAVMGTAALSNASQGARVNLSFNPDGSADRGRVEYVAVHEFGHVLGFRHEQDAPDNEGIAKCNDSIDNSKNPVNITPYDRDSVMNYCNRDGNGTGHLTDIDIQGVQKIYGERRKNIPSLNSCASAQFKSRTSLASAWNDSNSASVAVFPSDGTKFNAAFQRSIRDGGWGDDIKWVSGDFDGDGLTDLGAIWNNGGKNTLTVRLTRGNALVVEHWLADGGGWSSKSTWMSGDFNGDGKTDIAAAWNDGNKSSVAVYLSDAKKFIAPTQWSYKDGGWGDTIRWFAGDFDGDGKTDIGAAWNNGGLTTLSIRKSNGSGFTPIHWLANAGRWFDASVFVAGDFNGDGRADVAQVWNDIANNSIKVYISNGSGFSNSSNWASRDGGIPESVKWVPGDFNGDGRTDIAAIWDGGRSNTLTVRLSDGISKFNAAHWSTNNGGWSPTTAWCAGKF